MEQLIEFIKTYGWQLTLIAVAGVILLGILKYCKVFDKFEEKTRHFLYLLISVGLSIIGSVIYLACIHQLDTAFVFTFATAVFGVNQIAYTIYDTTPLRDLLSQLWDKIVEILSKKDEEGEVVNPFSPTAIDIPTAVQGLIYNGKEQIGVQASEFYIVKNGSATNAGEYVAEVSLVDKKKYVWKDETFGGKIKFTISKATYDLSTISIKDKILTYDGKEHSIVVEGDLPEGLFVEYSGNGQVEAGVYDVVISFKGDETNYNIVQPISVTLTIEKANYDLNGISFTDKKVRYDGSTHSILLNGILPEGVSVSYENNNQVNAGEYEIKASFTVSDSNFNSIPDMLAMLIIEKAVPVIDVKVDRSNVLYTTSKLPTLSLGEKSTPGTIKWEFEHKLQLGTKNYSWKYVPEDQINYLSVIGAVELIVVEAQVENKEYSISFADNTSDTMEVYLPALGDVKFSIIGTSNYDTKIESTYGITKGSTIELIYRVDGKPYLTTVDDYVTEFDIDRQSNYFIIKCTPDYYTYREVLARKWGSDDITFSKELTKEFTYKMIVTSNEGKTVTVYLEQD